MAGKPKRYSLFFVNERNRFYTIRLQIRFEKATGSSMETLEKKESYTKEAMSLWLEGQSDIASFFE